MAREDKALEGVRRAIPNDEILDVALTFPRGTAITQGAGMAIGGLAGAGSNMAGIGQTAGYLAANAVNQSASGLPPSIVLAVSPTTVYALGRPTAAPFRHWDDLTPLTQFDRSTLRVEHHHAGPIVEIHLSDTASSKSLSVEAKPIGNLGVTNVLALLDGTAEQT